MWIIVCQTFALGALVYYQWLCPVYLRDGGGANVGIALYIMTQFIFIVPSFIGYAIVFMCRIFRSLRVNR
jgi:hypothetical protein